MPGVMDTVRVRIAPSQVDEIIAEIAAKLGVLGADEQVAALVECMRTSAQETVEALARRGFAIVRVVEVKD